MNFLILNLSILTRFQYLITNKYIINNDGLEQDGETRSAHFKVKRKMIFLKISL